MPTAPPLTYLTDNDEPDWLPQATIDDNYGNVTPVDENVYFQ